VGTKVLTERTVSVLYPEEGNIIFFLNIVTHVLDYTVS
jgi:hypothetical protein